MVLRPAGEGQAPGDGQRRAGSSVSGRGSIAATDSGEESTQAWVDVFDRHRVGQPEFQRPTPAIRWPSTDARSGGGRRRPVCRGRRCQPVDKPSVRPVFADVSHVRPTSNALARHHDDRFIETGGQGRLAIPTRPGCRISRPWHRVCPDPRVRVVSLPVRFRWFSIIRRRHARISV